MLTQSSYKSNNLEDKSILCTHFYLMQKKKKKKKLETWFVSPASIEYFKINSIIFCVNKLTQKLLIRKINFQICFYRCSYKNSCFCEMVHNSSFLLLLICSLKEFLKMLLSIFTFWF